MHIESRKSLLENKPEGAIPTTQVRDFFSPECWVILESTKNSLGNKSEIQGIICRILQDSLWSTPNMSSLKTIEYILMHTWEKILYLLELVAFHNEALPIWALAGWRASNLAAWFMPTPCPSTSKTPACWHTLLLLKAHKQPFHAGERPVKKQNFTRQKPELAPYI